MPKHVSKREKGRAAANPVAIQAYLKGMSYPARRQDVLDCALENDAPELIMSALERIPDRDYFTPAELTAEVSAMASA